MSPLLHNPPAPQAIGGGSGRARKYSSGRICGHPDCWTVLRRTNPGPLCDPCTESAKARERAEGDAMNKGLDERRFQVMAYLLDKGEEWVTSPLMAKDLGIPRGTLSTTLGLMVKDGLLVCRVPAVGGGYRIAPTLHRDAPSDEVEKEEPVIEDVPAAPGHEAPADPPPEPPADEAPASDVFMTEPVTVAWPASFAGLSAPDDEAVAIGRCVDYLERLQEKARVRVLTYLADRYVP